MIKKTVAHIVYSPLQAVFTMKLAGGTLSQEFNAFTGQTIPNRAVVPLILEPTLYIKDPDGYIQSGDKTSELINCKWFVNDVQITAGSQFVIGDYGRLTVYANVPVASSPRNLRFTCSYIDQRRQEVLPFEWEGKMETIDTTSVNLTMSVNIPVLRDISPFKEGNVGDIISVQPTIYNGKNELTQEEYSNVDIEWQYYDKDSELWKTINPSSQTEFLLWCESIYLNALHIHPIYVNDILLRVVATYQTTELSYTFRLRRRYGQWEENIDIIEGKYIRPTTTHSKAEVKITNRRGNIVNPTKYFDIEILFKPTYSQNWRSISHTTVGVVNKLQLGSDYTQQPTFGALVREKTAYMPITVVSNNQRKVLCIDGKPICSQIPSSTREV